ncbi:MAG: TatD family hydrolase [Candidatus Baltobacteraceae bacterium]
MFIDSHAHLHDKAFDDDREAVAARMREAGVHTAVLVGCDVADSARAREAAHLLGVFASAGIHPHEAKHAPEDLEAAFAPLLADARVIAIGEAGLDYHYDHSPRDAQQQVLRAQIALARKRDLPIIFHHRDAFADFQKILREALAPQTRGVVHCFSGDTEQALAYSREFGLYLGIGGVITFKTADAIREAVRAAGLERLVLETDCPYLAPAPHRGKRNEPAFIPAIAARLAQLLDVSLDEVRSVTTRNACALFRI